MPLTLWFGVRVLGDRQYYLISVLLLLYTMVPFALVFERRRPQARELMLIAVLTALAVAGRGAFFMVPNFKPVAAIVILAAFWWAPSRALCQTSFSDRDRGRPFRCSALV